VEITATEQKVIDILVNHGKSPSMSEASTHAVDRAMGRATVDTRKFVTDLEDRKLIVRSTGTFNRLEQGQPPPMAESLWEACERKDM
jgi:hypothetical protein